jgi:site-specific recombinase XerD
MLRSRLCRTSWERLAEPFVTAPDGEPLTFQGLRHHFASWFMMRGGDLYALSKILGRAKVSMTGRYAHLAPDHYGRRRFAPSASNPLRLGRKLGRKKR